MGVLSFSLSLSLSFQESQTIMMTDKELLWHAQMKKVLRKLPDYVYRFGYRSNAVEYIGLNLFKELKMGVLPGGVFYTKSDIEWMLYELVELGQVTADVDSHGNFSNLKVASNDAADIPNLRESLAVWKETSDKLAHELTAAKAACEKAEANAAATKSLERVVEVQLKEGKKTIKKTTGTFHAVFPDLLDLAMERENIFAYGPTGSGKTFVFRQLAEVLNLSFGFVSCTAGMSESQLGGKLLPTGAHGMFEYTVSEFVKRYEGGGVFLLDEIWAADPNVLLFINAALSSDECAVPNRPKKPYAKRHSDFIACAADNTMGGGCDRLYTGRAKPDLSSQDRFAIGKVFMDYDPQVEKMLCPDDDLRNRLLRYREAINEHRLERCVSMRFMEKSYKMQTNRGWNAEKIDGAFFRGWREDEISKVKNF